MILFGAAEVVTAFRHEFFGISTSTSDLFAASATILGLLYAGAGLLLLTMRRGAPIAAMLMLGAVVLGRVGLVLIGLYPLDSAENMVAIVIGTAIAALFIVYIYVRLPSYR